MSWEVYYQKTGDFPPRPLTVAWTDQVRQQQGRTALDIGCGSGRDTAYLLDQGFQVTAIDNSPDSLASCRDRFGDHPALTLIQADFCEASFPPADLVLAWASLYFCPEEHFLGVWNRLTNAILPGGCFCGDFLGIEDSWVVEKKRGYAAFSEEEVSDLFKGWQIEKFHIRNEKGQTVTAEPKHWHSYTVVARKPL